MIDSTHSVLLHRGLVRTMTWAVLTCARRHADTSWQSRYMSTGYIYDEPLLAGL